MDTWAPKQKASAGRIVAMMRRNFPQGGELWKLVRVEFNRDKNQITATVAAAGRR